MPITIDVNSKLLNSNENKLTIHFLPAAIKGDGEAQVDKYFNKYTETKHGVFVNSLRGFPLYGQKLAVDSSYKGVVLQETSKPLDEDAARFLRVKGIFEDFTYWNYDKVPSASDGYKQALKFLDVAKELAEPISEADVQKELQSNQESI